jgi:hypothetical protein
MEPQRKFDREAFDRKIEAERRQRVRCQLCTGDKVQRYKEVRNDTQEIEYLCYCPDCGYEGDMLNINDAIYDWSTLPERRVFTSYTDYRDEGGVIEKREVNYDAKWDSPQRVKKV